MNKKITTVLLFVTVLCFTVVMMTTVTAGNQTALAEQNVATSTDIMWYQDNMACAVGLSLRDDLGLSDKWYNIVPVDLTVEGTQKIDMVASSLYMLGTAEVKVADGEVTVTYELPIGSVFLGSECLQWFTSLDEITEDFLNNPVGKYAFGEPVSISDCLHDQDVALLFICNQVTYSQPNAVTGVELTRYYANLDQWKNWREQLFALLETMETAQVEETEQAEETVATDTDLAATATDLI